MTAPDPLECLNSRAAAERTTCGEPDSAHCETCEMCPAACTCPKPSPWKKGDHVRITFDAIYLAEPSIKPDQYALVVLPDTDLDDNVLITNRFRVPLDAMTRLDTTAPRTWSKGDPEPEGVKFVRSDVYGYVFTRGAENGWHNKVLRINETWSWLLQRYGSVTEVVDE